jgi:uncharacterized protein YeeX (DUF496 family)
MVNLQKLIKKCQDYDGDEQTCFPSAIKSINTLKKIVNECKREGDLCKEHGSMFSESFLLVIEIANNDFQVEVDDYIRNVLNINDPLTIQDPDENSKSYGLFVSNLENIADKFGDKIFYKNYLDYSRFLDRLNDIMVDSDKLERITMDDLEKLVEDYISTTAAICAHLLEIGHSLESCQSGKKSKKQSQE